MSNGTDRKSMDDVLASIRRIVRAEKEPDSDAASREARRVVPHDAEEEAQRTGADDSPLALTPDMRSDRSDVEPEAIARPAGPAMTAGAPATDAPAADAPAMADRDSLRKLIREILAEELSSGAAEGAVRGIIRDELMNGDIGKNISQNVLRLIQSEVAKALEDR